MGTLPAKLSTKRELVRRQRVEIYTLPTEEEAGRLAAVLIASYPAGGRDGDVKVYLRQLRELLRAYPTIICEALLHPRTGVPGMVEGFPFPSLASVRAIADSHLDRRAAQLERLEGDLKLEEEELEERLFRSRETPEERAEVAERGIRLAAEIRATARKLAHPTPPRVGPAYFGITVEDHEAARAAAMDNLAKGVK
jgi:hypothetical protein